MKKQTMLKLILCFLIITGIVSIQEANAATICQTCGAEVKYSVDNGYVCVNAASVIEDNKGAVVHYITKCTTCGDGQIGQYGSTYKCVNNNDNIIIDCVAAGSYYYHKVSSCGSCAGAIYQDEYGSKYCNKALSRVDNSNKHITANTKCSTCNIDNAITNGMCSITSKKIHVDGFQNWHIADKECPFHEGIVIDKGSKGYTCVNTKQGVILHDGEFKHGDSFDNCGTCGNKIIDGKCSKDGTVVKEYTGNDNRFQGEDYHVVGTCNQNGIVIDMSTAGLYCNTHKLSVDKNYYHAPTNAGTTVIVGGPSAEAFFNAGKDNAKKGYDAVDGKIEPLLHIQSMIMMAGVYIAVIVVLIYACQWMMASPGRRQELKAGLWPLIIGVMLLSLGPKLAILIVETLLG